MRRSRNGIGRFPRIDTGKIPLTRVESVARSCLLACATLQRSMGFLWQDLAWLLR
jgi:hypothetical protein